MTEFDFEKKYSYDSSIKSEVFGEGQEGMLETYGNDVKEAIKIANKSPKRIWTMVDGDDGMYLINGYHLVNRIYYVVTNEEAESDDEYYLIESYEDDEIYLEEEEW